MTWRPGAGPEPPSGPALWRTGPRIATLGVVKGGTVVTLDEATGKDLRDCPHICVTLPLEDTSRDSEIIREAISAVQRGNR